MPGEAKGTRICLARRQLTGLEEELQVALLVSARDSGAVSGAGAGVPGSPECTCLPQPGMRGTQGRPFARAPATREGIPG